MSNGFACKLIKYEKYPCDIRLRRNQGNGSSYRDASAFAPLRRTRRLCVYRSRAKMDASMWPPQVCSYGGGRANGVSVQDDERAQVAFNAGVEDAEVGTVREYGCIETNGIVTGGQPRIQYSCDDMSRSPVNIHAGPAIGGDVYVDGGFAVVVHRIWPDCRHC